MAATKPVRWIAHNFNHQSPVTMFVRPDVVKTVTNEVVTAKEFGGTSPVGMMLIGKHFDEPIIYGGAAAKAPVTGPRCNGTQRP